jgi:hypothetical protein
MSKLDQFKDRGYRLAARTTAGGQSRLDPGKLLPWVAIAFGGLFLLTGAVRNWHRGAGEGSWIVEAIWHSVWFIYTIAKVAFIAFLIWLAWRYFTDERRGRNGKSNP